MFDLSVTTNLVVFAVMCAVALALIFFAVDIFASKKPSVAVKATATVFGALALVIGLASAFAAIGLKVGFVTLVGSDITLWSLRVPHIAGVVTLANYPVIWALAAALVALALLDIIGASLRRGKKAENGAVSSSAETETAAALVESHEEAKSETELVEAAFSEASAGRKRYDLDDVRGIMDEISGLVDNMGAPCEEKPSEPYKDEPDDADAENEEGSTAEDDELDFGYEPAGESVHDYFSELPVDETYEGESQDDIEKEPSMDESADKPEAFGSKDDSAEKDRYEEKEKEQVADESAAAIVPERVGKTLRPSHPREVEHYTTFAPKVTENFSQSPRKMSLKGRSENVKEVEPQIGGLPMTKRHVIINRRNVVNMFSEYLKTKSADEKERIESSINTIIIK